MNKRKEAAPPRRHAAYCDLSDPPKLRLALLGGLVFRGFETSRLRAAGTDLAAYS
jgi:hypothetical protein